MIDVNRERLLTVAQACSRLPSRKGKALNRETFRKWSTDGARGVRLETIKVGHLRYTSEEALQRFVAALNHEDDAPVIYSHRGHATIEQVRAKHGI